MPEEAILVIAAIFIVFVAFILFCGLKSLCCPKKRDKKADLGNISLDEETKKSIQTIRRSVDEKEAQSIRQEAEIFHKVDEKTIRMASKCDSGFYSSIRASFRENKFFKRHLTNTTGTLSSTKSSNSMSTVNGATFGGPRGVAFSSTLRSSSAESGGGDSSGNSIINYEDELKSVKECIRNTIHFIKRDPSVLHSIDEIKISELAVSSLSEKISILASSPKKQVQVSEKIHDLAMNAGQISDSTTNTSSWSSRASSPLTPTSTEISDFSDDNNKFDKSNNFSSRIPKPNNAQQQKKRNEVAIVHTNPVVVEKKFVKSNMPTLNYLSTYNDMRTTNSKSIPLKNDIILDDEKITKKSLNSVSKIVAREEQEAIVDNKAAGIQKQMPNQLPLVCKEILDKQKLTSSQEENLDKKPELPPKPLHRNLSKHSLSEIGLVPQLRKGGASKFNIGYGNDDENKIQVQVHCGDGGGDQPQYSNSSKCETLAVV